MIGFLVVLLLVLYVLERLSLEHGFDGVAVQTGTDRVLVEPDEPFRWTISVVNGKRWMLPYVRIRAYIPEGLMIEDGNAASGGTRGPGGAVPGNFSENFIQADQKNTEIILYLAGRQEATVSRTAAFPMRGRYFFRGASVECGDFFGASSRMESFPELREMIVKPRPLESERLRRTLGGYLGEAAVRRNLFEDPILTAGFYEYTGREPLRSISWSQSAKTGRLLVKRYDSTSDASCAVVLNVEAAGESRDGKTLERCFSMARSVCEEMEKQKISYSFHTNGVIAGVMGNWKQVGDGLGAAHLLAVLEGLGRMTYDCREGLDRLLARILKHIRPGQSILMITPGRGDAPAGLIRRLEAASGMRVLILPADGMEE